MNKEELKAIIPHRNSMLLIDEATKISEDTSVGKKTISGQPYCSGSHTLRNDGSDKCYYYC